jgi:two-component system nitrate/nitrite response regulator NarL
MPQTVHHTNNTHDRVRVLLADSMPAFRAGVSAAIKRHRQLELIGEAGDGNSTLALARARHPNVLLLDLCIAQTPANVVLAAVKRELPAARVIAITLVADGKGVYDGLKASVDGYLSRSAELEEICQATIAVAGGDTFVSRDLTRPLALEIRARASHRHDEDLTAREVEVLARLADGHSTHEIADALCIADTTVKTHRRAIFRKLGVHDHGAAVAQAFHKRILVP